ncbi:solute carrier family 2, facilitated glucose transporter member 8-like [Daphnia pulicaria]|uniref:solute carrier family 2, facilitated glucose transporter member 8-like n=1 Tax=Daphnia pulicaria TaxID=35523 RepID=UPI001EEC5C0E|nr:solute carrier family 2, facilitated glucose transporter member 8-like [Daphnia pulicaria]XP_046650293.1 solute carrier family 2, facilitated glucose transporter member 8-like [Daphnia pulicaria]
MATVNEGFVADEDGIQEKSHESKNQPISKALEILSGDIDYSAARKAPLFIATIAASWGAFILGSCLGWSSPVQPQLQHIPNATVPPHITNEESVWYIKLDDTEMSLVGSFVNLGALLGALTGGFLMDTFGRKMVLIFLSLPFVLGWLLIAVAVHPSMLYIGRILGGAAGGIASVVAPSYVSEISIPSMRGLLGFSFQLMVVLGILVVSLFGLGLDWRYISAIEAVFPVILLLSMIYIPESPYYLTKKAKSTEARNSLKWLRGPEYDMEPELSQMETRVRIELAQRSRFSDLWSGWAWKSVLVAIGLMVFQQLSGINAALFNAVAIFESAGSELDTLVAAVLLNVDQVLFCFISSLLVERLGRRTLFLMSEIGMCISMFALGAFFFVKEECIKTLESTPGSDCEQQVTALGWLPLTSLILFIATFAIGAGPMPWLMVSEILPAKVKAPGSSAAAFTNWFLAFIVTLTFVDIQNAIGSSGAFWMFGCFCILGILFTIFLLPETKGKSPEQIQAFFGIHPPVNTSVND